MKKRIIFILSVILGIFLLWWVFATNPISEVIALFSAADVPLIIIFISISFVLMGCLAYRWKLILLSQGHDIPFFNLLFYRITGHAVSFVTPSAKLGGEAVRAALLKNNGLSFARGISSVVIDKIIEFSSAGIFFFLGVLIVLALFAIPDNMKFLLILVSLILISITILFYSRILNGKDFFLHIFKRLRLHNVKRIAHWEGKIEEFEAMIVKFYHHDRKDFIKAILLTVVSWVLMFIEYKLILLMLGHDANILQIFLIFSFVGGAYIIPVPMALGVLEAAQVSIFSIMGFSPTGGIALALLIRGRDLLWTLIGFGVLPFYGIGLRRALESTMERPSEKRHDTL